MYGTNGNRFEKQYRKHLSDFKNWKDRDHAEEWLLFEENITEHLSIDEVCLSRGELYTVVTSKSAKGKKGSIVAIIRGTQSDIVIDHLLKIESELRLCVKEITLDMAGSMRLISQTCFPKAVQVIDRFHVQQLATEALQEIRVKHRWQAIDAENEAIIQCKKEGQEYVGTMFENGDTAKQLLARSRYLLYKSQNNWTDSQRLRATILFENYPDIKKAYYLTDGLRKIYNQQLNIGVARLKLAHWFKDIEQAGMKSFNTLQKTVEIHYNSILNYFQNRSTNASAESFNAKIKKFRTQFRGVSDKAFFLFRLTKIFA